MPSKDSVDQFFDSVNVAYDALLDAVKSANDRGYRISRKVIDEVEQAQRDTIDLGRRFATAPVDFAGNSSSAVRALTEAQSRTLDLARQILDEVSDSGREARDTTRKVIEANREAGQAAVEATRNTVKRAGPAVESAVSGVRSRVSRNSRKVADEAEKTSETA
jgi:gas vesicle protein